MLRRGRGLWGGPRPGAVVAAFAAGAWLVLPAIALAASPSPSRLVSSDTRSPLEGPGFVGDPATAILVVVAIALAAVALTSLYVRMSGGSRGPRA